MFEESQGASSNPVVVLRLPTLMHPIFWIVAKKLQIVSGCRNPTTIFFDVLFMQSSW
jgi:hypothetical protein